MQTDDQEFIGFVEQLQEWHAGQVAQLRLITENRTVDLRLNDLEVSAGSDIAKGLRLGIEIALQKLGTLPFTVREEEIEEDSDGQADQPV
ncbi:hypothetical protein K5M36_08580 [Chromobacterium vaccinii]|nr:hypothetical protein [Chromobacterium vaccinii]